MGKQESKIFLFLIYFFVLMNRNEIKTQEILIADYFSDLGFEADALSPNAVINPYKNGPVEYGKWYNLLTQEKCAAGSINAPEGNQYAILKGDAILFQCVDPAPFIYQDMGFGFDYQIPPGVTGFWVRYGYPGFIQGLTVGCTTPPGGKSCMDSIFISAKAQGTWQLFDYSIFATYDAGTPFLGFCLLFTGDRILIDNVGLGGCTNVGNCPKIVVPSCTSPPPPPPPPPPGVAYYVFGNSPSSLTSTTSCSGCLSCTPPLCVQDKDYPRVLLPIALLSLVQCVYPPRMF
jgi:hypothetical protein